MSWAVRLVALIVIPASVALFALAGPLTVSIYYHGEFRAEDVQMTRIALMAFSLALLGWSLIKVLATGYYARQDTRGPVKIAMRALGLTMALNLLVIVVLAITGHMKSPGAHALLALTNGVGAMLNAGLLYVGLVRSGVLRQDALLGLLVLRVVLATAAMAAFLWWFGGDLSQWLASARLQRVTWLAGLVAGGAGLYFAVLWLLGVRPAQLRLQSATTSL
jgi:putative peptidoglycan lipid II flippase